MKKRFRTVLVPYLVWSAFYLLHDGLFYGVGFPDPQLGFDYWSSFSVAFNTFVYALPDHSFLKPFLMYRLNYWVVHYVFIFVLGGYLAVHIKGFQRFMQENRRAITVFFWASLIWLLAYYYQPGGTLLHAGQLGLLLHDLHVPEVPLLAQSCPAPARTPLLLRLPRPPALHHLRGHAAPEEWPPHDGPRRDSLHGGSGHLPQARRAPAHPQRMDHRRLPAQEMTSKQKILSTPQAAMWTGFFLSGYCFRRGPS